MIAPSSLVKLTPWRKQAKLSQQIQTLSREAVEEPSRLEELRARYLATALALLKVRRTPISADGADAFPALQPPPALSRDAATDSSALRTARSRDRGSPSGERARVVGGERMPCGGTGVACEGLEIVNMRRRVHDVSFDRDKPTHLDEMANPIILPCIAPRHHHVPSKPHQAAPAASPGRRLFPPPQLGPRYRSDAIRCGFTRTIPGTQGQTIHLRETTVRSIVRCLSITQDEQGLNARAFCLAESWDRRGRETRHSEFVAEYSSGVCYPAAGASDGRSVYRESYCPHRKEASDGMQAMMSEFVAANVSTPFLLQMVEGTSSLVVSTFGAHPENQPLQGSSAPAGLLQVTSKHKLASGQATLSASSSSPSSSRPSSGVK